MASTVPLSRPLTITSIVLQVAVAGLFLMMSMGKLTGADDAKFIFEQVGMEPMGRYATGVAELVAAVMLFVPKTRIYGAILALMVIVGAIGSHLTKLGISVTLPSSITPEAPEGVADSSMFGMAVFVFVASAAVLVIRRTELPVIGAALTARGESKTV